jgi:hypothetical protein
MTSNFSTRGPTLAFAGYNSGMDQQPLPLPPEMSEAILANGGLPLTFEDPHTHELYLLVEKPIEITVDSEYIRAEVAKGQADLEAGRFEPWDVEDMLAEAHRRYDERNPP